MKKLVLNILMLILLINIIACNSGDPNDPRYTRLSDFEYLLVRDTSLKYGFIDSEFNEVIPCQFGNATFFENGLSIVKDSASNKYGLIDLNGDYVVEAQYDSITSINDSNYFIVQHEDLYALMNIQGVELTEFLYSEIKYGEYEPIIAVKDPETEKLLNTFFTETDYEMECSKICGKRFKSIDEHTEFIKEGGCKKLIDVLAGLPE